MRFRSSIVQRRSVSVRSREARPDAVPAATRRTAVLAALLTAAVLSAAPAAAEPPSHLPTPVSDQAGVLPAAQQAKVDRVTDKLFTDHQVELWVVFVKDFGGLTGAEWAQRTAKASELGSDNDVLLAVATDARAYYLFSPHPIKGLTGGELSDIAHSDTVPALKIGDWTAAALNTAGGIDDALTPSHTGLWVALGLAAVAVVGGAGIWLFVRRRRNRRIDAEVAAAREQELTADQLATQPIEVLDPWSREVLTDTDNAIRTSEEELRLAIGEFGDVQTAPFTEAVGAARRDVARSFAVRQRLDDDLPETPDERRSMLVQIITTCTTADQALDRQVADFDEMRNLLIDADRRLTSLTEQIVAARARLDHSRGVLADLTAAHEPSVIASVVGNADLADAQIAFAEDSADQGRTAASQPVGHQGPAVAAIRSAEGALAHAGRLLDGIDHAEENLAVAGTRIPSLLDELEGELSAAEALETDTPAGDGGGLDAAATRARAAVDAARSGSADDPLGTMTALLDADTELDAALAAARGAAKERSRRAGMLTSALGSAHAKVTAASDFIATRRGAVGATARTRLAEAQRQLDAAEAAGQQDSESAMDSARAAGRLGDEALMAAQNDVVEWQDRQQPASRSAASGAGAVLGGILVDSFLRGGMMSGGWGGGSYGGGGYSNGGRSPGSFGGSSSAGRIGVGGRF